MNNPGYVKPLAAMVRPDAPNVVESALLQARHAQAAWCRVPLGERLALVRRARHRIAEGVDRLADSVHVPQRPGRSQTLSAEVLPLAEACRFLEREAGTLLAPRSLGGRGRPFWLRGSEVELQRQPWGVVLIIAPANYPLLLPGVQALQALVAGNAVVLKPGRGGRPAAQALAEILLRCGLPSDLLAVLEEQPEQAVAAMRSGVDKVVLTGSYQTGRDVLGQLAATVTPAVMELSGCDAVFVRADADLDLVVRALTFGSTLNGGFTCIAPRRVFAHESVMGELRTRLARAAAEAAAVPLDAQVKGRLEEWIREAVGRGATLCSGRLPLDERTRPLVVADVFPASPLMREDIAAPVLSLVAVNSDDEALALAAACDYELGATVFGQAAGSRAVAERVRAGVVVINDMIVPTADPRVPFGGRGRSGFGVTRGAEGLLEMTRAKTIILRRGRFRPHLDPVGPREQQLLEAFVQVAHAASLRTRMRAAWQIVKTIAHKMRHSADGNSRKRGTR